MLVCYMQPSAVSLSVNFTQFIQIKYWAKTYDFLVEYSAVQSLKDAGLDI